MAPLLKHIAIESVPSPILTVGVSNRLLIQCEFLRTRSASTYASLIRDVLSCYEGSTIVLPALANKDDNAVMFPAVLAARSLGLKVICVYPSSRSPSRPSLSSSVDADKELCDKAHLRLLGADIRYGVFNVTASQICSQVSGAFIPWHDSMSFHEQLNASLASRIAKELPQHGVRWLIGNHEDTDIIHLIGRAMEEHIEVITVGIQHKGNHVVNDNNDIKISCEEATPACRRLAAECGLLCDISTGAALVAGTEMIEKHAGEDAGIAVVFCIRPHKHPEELLGTCGCANEVADLDNSTALHSDTFDDDIWRFAAVEDLNLAMPKTVTLKSTNAAALAVMQSEGFDNLPVLNTKKRICGLLTRDSLDGLSEEAFQQTVDTAMLTFSTKNKYIPITLNTPLSELQTFFKSHSTAFVTDENNWCLGVVTESDLRTFLTRRRHQS